MNKEKCKSLYIDYTKLGIGMIIGRAILYDVKKYDSKTEFMKDKNRHYADTSFFDSYMYDFKIKNVQRLRHPIPFSDELGFFEVNQSIIIITE